MIMCMMLLKGRRVSGNCRVLNASRSRGRRIVLSMRIVVGVGLMVNMLGCGWCGRWGIRLSVSIAGLMWMLL